jgi:hypothetical protein
MERNEEEDRGPAPHIYPALTKVEKIKRDWTTMSLSILALAVSIANFYISSIRQTTNVRTVLSNGPTMSFANQKRTRLTLCCGMTASFMNVGNRPVIISGTSFLVSKPTVLLKRKASGGDCIAPALGIYTNLETFVLREKDVMLGSAKFVSASNGVGENHVTFANGSASFDAPVDANGEPYQITICVRFNVVTTSTDDWIGTPFPVATFKVRGENIDADYGLAQSPIVISHEIGSIFD